MNIERNMFKRENRFFRTIINKLQAQNNCNECYTIEKEEIYRKFEKNAREQRHNKSFNTNYTQDVKARQNYGNQQQQMPLPSPQPEKFRTNSARSTSTGYNLKQKLCVNICNNNSNNIPTTPYCDTCSRSNFNRKSSAYYTSSSSTNDFTNSFNCVRNFTSTDSVGNYLHNYGLDLGDLQYETEIPIRYTLSDNSLFCNNESIGTLDVRKSNSNTSLTSMISSRRLYGNNEQVEAEFVLKVRKEGI